MRRKLLAPVIGALVLLGSMLPATALGVTAGQSPVVDTASVDHLLPRIRLGCVLIQPDATPTTDSVVPHVAPAITCRWSAVDSPRVFVYQLWRIRDAADGGSRRLIARVRPGDALRYRDVRVKAGHTYTYKVVARAASGRKIAASRLVTVRIPRPDEVLRMACAPATVGDRQGVVCKWSEATHPRAARYVLWRSVDGGAREKVFRTGLDGRRWHFDTDGRGRTDDPLRRSGEEPRRPPGRLGRAGGRRDPGRRGSCHPSGDRRPLRPSDCPGGPRSR